MVLLVVGRRACAVVDGLEALHWNMLSLFKFGCCTGVLHAFSRGWVVRVVIGGCMLGLGRVGVIWFVGESAWGVVVLC